MKKVALYIMMFFTTLFSNEEKIYKVAFLTDWAPYYYLDDDNNPQGYAKELFEEIAKKINLKFEYVYVDTWDELYKKLEKKEISIVPNIGISELRKDSLIFSQSTDTFDISLFKRASSHHINTINDLKNTSVGVTRRNICENIIDETITQDKRVFKYYFDGFNQLISGNIDSLCYPNPLMLNIIKENKLENHIVSLGEPILEVKRSVATLNNELDLLLNINDAITELKIEGKHKKIYTKWFGNNHNNQIHIDIEDIKYYGLVVSIFIVIIIFLIYKRNTQINKRILEKELERKTRTLENQKRFLDLVFNTFPYCAITSNGKEMTSVNQKTLDFFGFDSFEKLVNKHKCVCDFFVEEKGFISKEINQEKWTKYISKNPGTYHALVVRDNQRHILDIEVKHFDDDKFYLVILKDITQQEKYLEKIKHQTEHDTLTGIYNRLKFNEIVDFQIKRYHRNKFPLSTAIIDIDHFKNVNDTYGHLEGDDVLKKLTKHINENIREIDIFARWGGEEFVLLMIDTPLKNAVVLAEKLRKQIEDIPFSKAEHITCSFGVTQLKDEDTIESMFNRCDEALYEAKGTGRNKVVIKE